MWEILDFWGEGEPHTPVGLTNFKRQLGLRLQAAVGL